MSSSTFSVGDLVWAKMKGYPPWPAKITTPPTNLKSLAKTKKGHQCCFFFGSKSYSWIPDEHVYKHSESMIPQTKKKQSAQFHEAINTIVKLALAAEDDAESLTNEDDAQNFACEDDKESSVGEDDEAISIDYNYEEMQPSTSGIASKRKTSKEKIETSKKRGVNVQKRSRRFSTSSENSKANISNPKKRKRSQKPSSSPESSESNDDENITEPEKGKGVIMFKRIIRPMVIDDETSQSSSRSNEIICSVSSDEESPNETLSFVARYEPDSVPKCTERPTYVGRSPTPEFDITEESEIVKARRITPVAKRFGFLGLGFMGRIIAKHILHSGHHLTVWNRSPEKCDEFIEAGARRGQTPADVVAASDIIFCCLSDTDAVRSIVFDNCGVLEGMGDGAEKGFCVLNTINPYASIEISSAISSKGGSYLEAFIHGTRTMAENGTLLIIAGGSDDCFGECCSCFRVVAKDVFYVNYDIGEAAVVNIFLNVLNACIISSLAGVMSFVSKNGGSLSLFTEFLSHSRLKSNALIRNANAIISRDFSTDLSVKHVLQSLNSALELTNTIPTPTYLSSLVQEYFKSASLLRYFDHDASSVFQAM